MLFRIIIFSIIYSFTVGSAHALPFNDDMVMMPHLRTGSVARATAPNTVSRSGSENLAPKTRAQAEALENPVEPSEFSLRGGKRSFETNCSPCHGEFRNGKRVEPLAAESFLIVGPDLILPQYVGRTDGFYFGAMHFGSYSTIMPPVGWKLSINETWDIVNYIRSIQAQ